MAKLPTVGDVITVREGDDDDGFDITDVEIVAVDLDAYLWTAVDLENNVYLMGFDENGNYQTYSIEELVKHLGKDS